MYMDLLLIKWFNPRLTLIEDIGERQSCCRVTLTVFNNYENGKQFQL